MDQTHKRFTTEQINVLLKGYCQGMLDRPVIEETLGINRSIFHPLGDISIPLSLEAV
jgi:hypothetical protein